jgi:hypothetical protein
LACEKGVGIHPPSTGRRKKAIEHEMGTVWAGGFQGRSSFSPQVGIGIVPLFCNCISLLSHFSFWVVKNLPSVGMNSSFMEEPHGMNSWCDKKDDDDHSSNLVFRERKTEIGFSVMKLRSGRNLEKLRESLYGLNIFTQIFYAPEKSQMGLRKGILNELSICFHGVGLVGTQQFG